MARSAVTGRTPHGADALVIVGEELREEVARCVAAAGYRGRAGLVDDLWPSRQAWHEATVVIVDLSAVSALAHRQMPRRDALLVVESETDSTTRPGAAGLWPSALRLGAQDGYVLGRDAAQLVRALTALRAPHRRGGVTIAVIGGHGGAGASTLAAATAICAAEGPRPTMLLDVDPYGPGADLLLGLEDDPGLRWDDLRVEGGDVHAAALFAALPSGPGGVAVLAPRRGGRTPVSAGAARAVMNAGAGDGDVVVVDLPRRIDDTAAELLAAVGSVVVVTTATVGGCAATRQLTRELTRLSGRVGLVVRGPAPGGLTVRQVQEALGLPLLAGCRAEPRLAGAVETGALRLTRRSPLRRAAAAVLAGVSAEVTA